MPTAPTGQFRVRAGLAGGTEVGDAVLALGGPGEAVVLPGGPDDVAAAPAPAPAPLEDPVLGAVAEIARRGLLGTPGVALEQVRESVTAVRTWASDRSPTRVHGETPSRKQTSAL